MKDMLTMDNELQITRTPSLPLLIASYLADKNPSTQITYSSSLSYLFEWMGSKYDDESLEEFLERAEVNPEIISPTTQLTPLMGVAFKKWLEVRGGNRRVRGKGKISSLPSVRVKGRGMSASTLKRHFTACRGLLKWLTLHGVKLSHPDPLHPKNVTLPKVSPQGKTRALRGEEVLAMMQVCDAKTKEGKRDLCMLALFFGAGLRMHEALSLRIEDVQASRKGTPYLFLEHTKKGVEDKQPLPKWAADRVLAWKKLREKEGAEPSHYLLAPLRGGFHGGMEPLDQSGVNRRLKRIAMRAKVSGEVSAHVGRTTSITQLLEQGHGHREVRRFSRHGSVSMVERYDRGRKDVDENAGLTLEYKEG